jgi:hypothetical protein
MRFLFRGILVKRRRGREGQERKPVFLRHSDLNAREEFFILKYVLVFPLLFKCVSQI